MRRDPVVSRLMAKRAELAGIIAQRQRQIDQDRADLMHIDGVLRILASDLDPETIRPKRRYRRTRYFGRNELSRLCLSAFRIAAGKALSTGDIADYVVKAKGLRCCGRHPARRDPRSSGIDRQAVAPRSHD
jgi:hypothetical protein